MGAAVLDFRRELFVYPLKKKVYLIFQCPALTNNSIVRLCPRDITFELVIDAATVSVLGEL